MRVQVSAVYQDPDTNRAAQRPRQGHTGSIFAQAQPAPAPGPAPANGVLQQPSSTLPVVNPYQIPANMLVMPSMMPDGEQDHTGCQLPVEMLTAVVLAIMLGQLLRYAQ